MVGRRREAPGIGSLMCCSECGATASAACECGVPYVPKRERAIEAVRANPEKSDRAIAQELGVALRTVQKARGELTTGSQLDEPAKRVGRDGKARRLPVRFYVPDAATVARNLKAVRDAEEAPVAWKNRAREGAILA